RSELRLREPVALLHLCDLVLRDREPLLGAYGAEREPGGILPAPRLVVDGVRVLSRRRRARVDQLRLEERRALGPGEQTVEEGGARRVLVVPVELARAQLCER